MKRPKINQQLDSSNSDTGDLDGDVDTDVSIIVDKKPMVGDCDTLTPNILSWHSVFSDKIQSG